MSGVDGLNFDDILKKVAGSGVDLGESKVAVPDKKEETLSEDKKAEGLEVTEAVSKIKKETRIVPKKKNRISPKAKTERNDKDYSCAKIKKRYIKLIRILFPDVYVQEGVEKIFEEWEKNNWKKIQEALKNL